MRRLFTSESVTEGHPDKVCDQISDAILDEILKQDPNGRVACETTATTGYAMVMGEITTSAYVDIPGIVRRVILDIGYDRSDYGFDGNTCAVLGYRNSSMFLKEEFEQAAGRVIIATEDGSFGTKGTVIDAMEAEGYVPKAILSCGPKPMLRALKAWAAERNIPLWVSMEERMACGVGACLGCITETTETDSHSKVKNRRVCKDGPVFRAEEVVL